CATHPANPINTSATVRFISSPQYPSYAGMRLLSRRSHAVLPSRAMGRRRSRSAASRSVGTEGASYRPGALAEHFGRLGARERARVHTGADLDHVRTRG